MQPRVGIALGGGGSKGDFEVGALRYLYEIGIRPDIVTGSSVGAINALKLAEGGGAGDDHAQRQLERIWRGLSSERDMYELEPWMQTIQDLRIQEIIVRGMNVQGSSALASWLRLPALLVSGLIGSGLDIHAVADAVNMATRARSIYNLGPVERLMRDPATFDPGKLATSGIRLRLSMVGLESGKLRHADERGNISGVEHAPVDIVDAAMASASIPMMYPPRFLAGEHYVDGGIRQIMPILPAIDAGATEIYGITAAQQSLPADTFAGETLVPIGMRAFGDLMVDEITEGDIREATSAGRRITMTIIRPSIDVHDLMTIDPGLIDISIDYGYMRAADVLGVGLEDRDRAMSLSDEITSLRINAWKLEESINHSRPRQILTSGDRSTLSSIRSLKRSIHARTEERAGLGAAVPADTERLWSSWEIHRTPMQPDTPWSRVFTTFGPLPDASPPGPLR